MKRVIAAMNITADGFCDHTAGIADGDLHKHYSELLQKSGVILYGKTTYQLMQYWQTVLKNPTGEKSTDEFAAVMDKTPKIVFSHTLKNTGWDSAVLSEKPLEEKVAGLRQEAGGDILIGSRSLIVQLMNLNLIDELQLCIHPVVIGKGLPLFDKIADRTVFKLLKTKTFGSGSIVCYYQPMRA